MRDDSKKKRVLRACDTCRVKKAKCDGLNPCSRCTTDNQVCTYTHKRKNPERVFTNDYVELLESRLQTVIKSFMFLVREIGDGRSVSKYVATPDTPVANVIERLAQDVRKMTDAEKVDKAVAQILEPNRNLSPDPPSVVESDPTPPPVPSAVGRKKTNFATQAAKDKVSDWVSRLDPEDVAAKARSATYNTPPASSSHTSAFAYKPTKIQLAPLDAAQSFSDTLIFDDSYSKNQALWDGAPSTCVFPDPVNSNPLNPSNAPPYDPAPEDSFTADDLMIPHDLYGSSYQHPGDGYGDVPALDYDLGFSDGFPSPMIAPDLTRSVSVEN